ncbi:MAG: type II toxin-antitoxin system HicB family antitoxin [Candidatus Aminicenantes bacterium]|nr:type II toxin-antitoxin system HicB family antitoxin [Candidatus Aminicenantes bacterium]
MEKFTAVYEKMNDGWIGYVEELSGANTQGKTRDEVKENLKEAVQLIIEADRELARREVIDRNVIREELLGAV